MTFLEIALYFGWALWWAVCFITAGVKDRSMGWAVAAALVPPVYVVLLFLRQGAPGKPERIRCPSCRLGWVRIDVAPRICSGCGQEITHLDVLRELERDIDGL